MLNFKKDGCEVYEDLLPKETSKFVRNYTIGQYTYNYSEETPINRQLVSGRPTHVIYSDPVMDTIITMIQPKIEEKVGLKLSPTYTYYRRYQPGNALSPHIDKSACEISVTIMLDAQYKNDNSYRWNIFADPTPYRNGENLEPRTHNFPTNKGIAVEQKPGDGLIYRGCDIPHWREEFIGEQGSYHTQLFCHYIDKNGPYYPKWKYDSRPGLGFPPSTKKY